MKLNKMKEKKNCLDFLLLFLCDGRKIKIVRNLDRETELTIIRSWQQPLE